MPDRWADRNRRDTFDSAAESYERGRPGYPDQLVEELLRLADIGPASRVLEIGPGTGQLSVILASRGASLVAVELGPRLAAIARRNLAPYASAEVIVADFDRWEGRPGSFDAVVAATSFHWLDPSTRLERCASLLRPGGLLAVLETNRGVAVGADPFFAASQTCYARWHPGHDPDHRQTTPDDVHPVFAELAGSGLAGVAHRRHLIAREYDTESYCDLLRTFSDVLALDETSRAGFLACMAEVIDARFDGRIARHELYDLSVAQMMGTAGVLPVGGGR